MLPCTEFYSCEELVNFRPILSIRNMSFLKKNSNRITTFSLPLLNEKGEKGGQKRMKVCKVHACNNVSNIVFDPLVFL